MRALLRLGIFLLIADIGILGHPEVGLAARPDADVEGKVRFYNIADSDFDVYSRHPSEADQVWMRENYLRMQTYASFFTSRLSWYPNAWAYKDSYAIKPSWTIFREHPEWVLRDADGNMLFIPWGCSDGTCPQYAGDIGDPSFRANWIAEASALLDLGYTGLWVDDVNLTWRVSNGDGDTVMPVDPRTDKEMTLADWRRYFAEFMEEIRAAFPTAEIAHNAIWYAGPLDNPSIRRQIEAADYFNFERGATDRGLKSGTGKYGFETFLQVIDSVHAYGTNVILMDYGSSFQQREYGLAAWFLINDGTDMVSSSQLEWTAPDNWWPGYDLNLGAAQGPRFMTGSVIMRNFDCGAVLLNQPDERTAYVDLGMEATNLAGGTVTSVSLAGDTAAILTWPCDQSFRRPFP